MEFGANYPYETETPFATEYKKLKKCKGSFGQRLEGQNKDEIFENIPKYARVKIKKFPNWKIRMIERSRNFYDKNKKWLDSLIPELIDLQHEAYQKLEWNCQGEEFSFRKLLLLELRYESEEKH